MGSCQSFDGKSDAKHKGKPQILIKSFTWSRDSHGLFDYESKNLAKNAIKNTNAGILVRRKNDITFGKEADLIKDAESKPLVNLTIKEGNYWVQSIINRKNGEKEIDEDYNNNEQSIWMVVKSFRSTANGSKPGFKLTEGDLIKLGRIKFRVKEFRGSANHANEKKVSPENDQLPKVEDKVNTVEELPEGLESQRRGSKASLPGSNKSLQQQTCRICLGEESDAEDPFFCPCNCSGTMKYIHVLCLQRWLKGKIHRKESSFSTSIYWKTLECELCKVTYPSSFTVNNKKYDIVELIRPDTAYIILEILSKEKNILRGIHVIKMDGKNNVRLGRGHDSDIRITDISVSRCHALIKLDKGNYYLEDNNSKFGTLVHLKKPFPLCGDYNNISLQIGRSVISLSVKKNWNALSKCFGNGVRDPSEIIEDEEMSPINRSVNDDEPHGLDRGATNVNALELPGHVGAFDGNNVNGLNEDGLPAEGQREGEDIGSHSDIPDDEDEINEEGPENNEGEALPNDQQNVENAINQNEQQPQAHPQPEHQPEHQALQPNHQSHQQHIPENDVLVENFAN